ncbi:MAG: TGS domain-containing protein, partial [Gammaproteobacteria bacterium]
MPIVTLPDGSRRNFENSLTVAEVARSIGSSLAQAALAGRLNGRLVDTSWVIQEDAQLAIVTGSDPQGVE